MDVQLNSHEARVLGVLIEKSMATPDLYPLTLNSIGSGCNQKSNRHPVVDYSEAEILVALQGLQMKHLSGGTVPAGSRVEKFHHNAKQHFGLGEQDLAVLAELLLRGPQTSGELRTRASRMRTIASLDELGQCLDRLLEKGYAIRMAPRPGSRAERFAQTLCPNLHPEDEAPAAPSGAGAPRPAAPPAPAPAADGRFAALEARVERLERQLEHLAAALGEPLEPTDG